MHNRGNADQSELAGIGQNRIEYLVQRSVSLLWANVPADGKPYIGAFSGGKDSCVIKELAKIAGVHVEWHYRVTTLDPPELIRFIKKEHPDVIFDKPKYGSLFKRALEKNAYPSRQSRWCCSEYKEFSPDNSTTITGVRIAEGNRRAKVWTSCVMQSKSKKSCIIVMPIRIWKDEDVWNFIHSRGLKYCELYNQGFNRIGCIGCPMATRKQREIEFKRWPAYAKRWKKLFVDLWDKNVSTIGKRGKEWFGSRYFDSAEELYDWWMDRSPAVTKWRQSKGLPVKDEN